MRRWIWLTVVLLAVGCNVFPAFIAPPTGNVVPGGIADTRPLFGRARLVDPNGTDVGLLMIASCGCGDWRMLMKPDNGSPQTQFTISFYSEYDYRTTGEVMFFGQKDGKAVMGTIDQDSGLATGHFQNDAEQLLYAAIRTDAHEQEVDACGLCHIGDDPIWPLPPQHNKKYLTNPRVCFECHTVDGK
jgi:hypothetical protein